MAKSMLPNEITAFQQRFSDAFANELSRDIAVDMLDNPPREVKFPMVIFLVNALFDVLCFLSGLGFLTGVGAAFMYFFTVLTWIINPIWWFGKEDGIVSRSFKKLVLRSIVWVIVLFIVGDTVGFSGIFANSLLILVIHYREKRAVKAFWLVIAEFHRIAPKQLQQMIDEADSNITRRARNRQT